jgi:uncharacterized membrane protein
MRKIITSAAVAATAAALLGGTGIAAAASHPAAAQTESFQLMSTSGSNKSSAVFYGAFTAGGVDVSGNSNTDTVTFANGTLKLVHKITGEKEHLNPTTCLLTASGNATYTLGGGTGAYKGISGSGKATLNILGIAARNSKGKCSPNAAPVAYHFIVNGSGPVTLP